MNLTDAQRRALGYAEGPARQWRGATARGLWDCLDKGLVRLTEDPEYRNGVVLTPAGHAALQEERSR